MNSSNRKTFQLLILSDSCATTTTTAAMPDSFLLFHRRHISIASALADIDTFCIHTIHCLLLSIGTNQRVFASQLEFELLEIYK